MALPILDGNQTSTTLATTVSGGAHYPNHILASAVTISNFPDTQQVAGTITANVGQAIFDPIDDISIATQKIAVQVYNSVGNSVNFNTPFDISGTVTASNLPLGEFNGVAVQITDDEGYAIGLSNKPIYIGGVDGDGGGRVFLLDTSGRTVVTGSVGILGTPSVTVGAISGTVTANNPNGTLTTRFGSVTTANTAQITTAVTNSSRKYLLAQNISAGTVTIGIGFSPTTTQGIQLTAGAGITFDSFVPTGAVWWLGATTGATWTILEG